MKPRPVSVTLFMSLLFLAAVSSATPLGEELLAPAAPRPAPRDRPETKPLPALYTARSVVYAAGSADGKWIATVEKGDNGSELWLHPAAASAELPRLLLSSPVRLAAPALNRDGSLLAYVDASDDVKGDIWLFDIAAGTRQPRRLTGTEAADDAPVFSADGSSLVYQRQLPGTEQRQLVRLDYRSGAVAQLPLPMDAGFAAPAADGRRWVLVSRRDNPGGNLWLWDERSNELTKITSGADRDIYPVWEGEATILFTRFSLPGESGAVDSGRIFRLQLNRQGENGLPAAFPLTAGTFPAVAPLAAGDRVLFIAGQDSGGQLLYLPASGEIPERAGVAGQWQLALTVIERQPPDPAHARLACQRVQALEDAPAREGALAGLALAALLERGGEPARAEAVYALVAGRYAAFNPEAAFAQIGLLRVEASRRLSGLPAGGERRALLAGAAQAMAAAARGKGDRATARARIDTARLLTDSGDGAADRLAAMELYEQVAALADVDRPVRAEAAFRRALLLASLEKGEGAMAALAAVARDFDDQEEWAEAAIATILDQLVTGAGGGQPGLGAVAEKYRTTLPRLAMGAWNRSGDLAYRANEWARAKNDYRTVLEQFAPLPTPTAAARFALAEVLYREERYAEAIALYERELKEQPEDAPIYGLARSAYIRKTLAAGENLYRLGEVAAARATFLDLIRYDGRSIEAHRGYIKSVAAQGQAMELLDLYSRLLQQYPDDPVLLYATGLCRTYLAGRDHLDGADRLIARAAERMPESEFPPQTRGYLAEVAETVYGERGGLERALNYYRRAWLLNRSRENPANRANLDLNIGNIAYLLGSHATARTHYSRRLAAGVPFDNPETELIFHERYAAVAFQLKEREAPISGYAKALELLAGRINPSRPLELFGRCSRRIVERLFTPMIPGAAAERALFEQQSINSELELLGETPPEAVPSPGWDRFAQALRRLLERERALLAGAGSWNDAAMARYGAELQSMLQAVTKELDELPRLLEKSAAIHDRLGLAYLEAERFAAAREQFETAYRLNRELARMENLAANRRSASIAAYRQAETATGEERLALLRSARDGFREVPLLLEKHPPKPKAAAERSGGLFSFGAEVALDKTGATQAAFGFSPEQERRLAETFLARISAELGNPAESAALLQRQLQRYPPDNERIALRDMYGVGLLAHRSAQVDNALGNSRSAADGFRRSALLALKAGNPVSAMLNLVNLGEQLDVAAGAAELDDFLRLEAQTSQLVAAYRASLPGLARGRYHNDTGAILARLAPLQTDNGSRQALLFAALQQWDRALATVARDSSGEGVRTSRLLQAAAQLNRSAVLAPLGQAEASAAAAQEALDAARSALSGGYEWRALAALGRYEEALTLLETLPPTEFNLQRGELAERFSPRLRQLAAGDGEGAFALLERLSEFERVQLIGRSVLRLDNAVTRSQLALAAPRLEEIDRLRSLSAAASPAEKDYLELRIRQEESVIDGIIGKTSAGLPRFYAMAGAGVVRLTAAAARLDELAAAAVAAGKGPTAEYAAARLRFTALQQSYTRACGAGKGERLCLMLSPQPVEAVDLLERMAGRTVLRFTPLDERHWLLFTIGGKAGISAETVERATLEARLAADRSQLAAYEEPQRFSRAEVASWGLSASHLLRSFELRKPFRRQVLDLSGGWPEAAPFARLPAEQWLAALPAAQTLVLPGRAGLLTEAPYESGRGADHLPQWEDRAGERHSLLELTTAENLSLVVAPAAGSGLTYSLGHLLSLSGVPSLLLTADPRDSLPRFAAAYGNQSAAAARGAAVPSWLLLGDWGPDPVEAAALGKKLFADYGKRGVLAFNEKRFPQALALFENGLTIAGENADLARQRVTLYRYARESAFAAGDTARAIYHGEALVALVAKEKPFSADHADALLRLGLLQGRAEQFSAAAASLKESVAIFADLGLAGEQAAALADFGVVMENSLDYTTARSLFEESADLQRSRQDDISLAGQYRHLGRLYDLRLNQYALAESYYARAGEIYARAGNGVLEAETLLERGRCQRLLGNFPAADDLYRQALARVGDKELRTRMRVVLEQANNAWFQGRYQEAFDLREQVEKSALREGWSLEQVMAKNTGGLIWWTLGNNRRALLELRAALEKAGKLEVRRDEVATTLNNIGLVQREAGEYKEALATLEQALAIDRQLGSRWAMAYDLRNLALTRLKMGEAAKALQLLDEAYGFAAAIGDRVNLAKILLAKGDTEAVLKQEEAAGASYRQALLEADQLLLREVRWRALFGLARLQQAAGNTGAAVDSYRLALETVEGLRAEIKLDLLKDGFLSSKMDVYTGLVGLLVDLQRNDEAFAVAERSRARNLIDILGRQRLSLAGTVEQELYDRQNRLKGQMLEQEALAAQAVKPQERTMYGQALDRLRADYQDLLLDIERQRPELLSLVKVEPVSLDEIRKLLEPGVVLLSYYQLPGRLLCWRISRDRADLFILATTAAELADTINSYRRMLQNLEPLERVSRDLYDRLLAGPLADAGDVKALGIIPHGSLHYLAFATLGDGRDYLVDRHPLFYLPAASVLRYTLARRQTDKNLRVLAIGNPDLGNRSLDLPFAEREAATLQWNYPQVTTLTRERATESWVRDHISEFGIIHLASHGEFDPVNPLFSAVRLAPDEKSDGRLQAEEVFGLEIKADLVVLSACQTGLGDIRAGDDVVGMNRAFIFAGTHSLMSSLWRVSDVSTAILMKQFYREYTRSGKADSLRKATLHVKNRYPHPGYWGAFVLTGDYQ